MTPPLCAGWVSTIWPLAAEPSQEGRGVPGEVFETEAWFANLLAHGFEQTPHQHRIVPLNCSGSCLHLMQQTPGAPLASLGNYYSCLYGPVAIVDGMHGVSSVQWHTVAQTLRRLPGGAKLQLQPLDADSAWLDALQTALQAAGYWTDRFFCFGNWYQPVPEGGFGVYWQQRPSALRHSMERGRRRLDSAGAWRIDIQTHTSEGLEPALAAYQAVYAQSWKPPEPCPAFMPELVRMAAREGWLRLAVLWMGERPLAAQVWLVHGGKANIYKLAYAKGWEKFSAGTVLTHALMEYVMEVDRVQEVDYLSGDDAYKADWMALRRERVGLVAFDRSRLCGLLAAGRHFAGAWRRKR